MAVIPVKNILLAPLIKEPNKPEVKEKTTEKFKIPSQLDIPVFVLIPPFYVDTKIQNNIWMKELKDIKIDKEKFLNQWMDLYEFMVSAGAMVFLVPPKEGLQDATYVNSGVYLPHVKNNNVVVLSNFKAEGRAGEEVVLGAFLSQLGYEIIQSPYHFEGEPELKYLRDNIYFGGYGQRTDIKALRWLNKTFDANVVLCYEQDPKLYHLDCSIFVFNEENVLVATDLFDKQVIKAIEKVANILPCDKDDAYQGICNSVAINNFVLNASSIVYMDKDDELYDKEVKKNTLLEKYCIKLGFEPVFINLSECAKSGAMLSCFCMHLNYISPTGK